MPPSAKALPLSRNFVSEIGIGIAAIGLANLAFLVYLDATRAQSNPYMGILTWIVAPVIFMFGLGVFLLGLLLERRRRRLSAPGDLPQYPRLDLNERRTRLAVIWGALGLILFMTMSVVGSYHAYHYTESDAFCGTACHSVMHPEYAAYQVSPHARVGCASCHVGSGAGSFARAKLNGTHQLYSLLTNKYPRPIPSPVENLRPARETCEQCHWPEKFFGTQLKTFSHYAYDEASTPREVRMLINTGGGSPLAGETAGIHWHMNIANEVTYASTDRQRQVIPWVRVRNRKTGQVTEYRSTESKLTDAQLAAAPRRRMDCVDCHSRPAHIYVSPDRAVDRALHAGRIDRSLPFIKQEGVALLVKDYPSTSVAVRSIRAGLTAFYRDQHAAVYAAKTNQVAVAATALQQIFETTRFPDMRVDWRTHPDNAGHMRTLGCFRCHDDQHVSKEGKRLSKECTLCHTLLAANGTTAAFEHPIDLGDLRTVTCSDCHTGGGM
jgi:nitrate/TMAO reductase-like tetraheme cytochrome c subunit